MDLRIGKHLLQNDKKTKEEIKNRPIGSLIERIEMADTTSGSLTSYQGHHSNTRRGFIRSCGKPYGRGQGRGCVFNSIKPKVQGKCEALGSDIYFIGDPRQEEKYTKMTEVILNHNREVSTKETM